MLAQGFQILAVSSKLVLLNNYTEQAIIDCSSMHTSHVWHALKYQPVDPPSHTCLCHASYTDVNKHVCSIFCQFGCVSHIDTVYHHHDNHVF